MVDGQLANKRDRKLERTHLDFNMRRIHIYAYYYEVVNLAKRIIVIMELDIMKLC